MFLNDHCKYQSKNVHLMSLNELINRSLLDSNFIFIVFFIKFIERFMEMLVTFTHHIIVVANCICLF